MIESLESRIAPATFTVTSLADAGAGSLRDAIAQANDAPGADIILFKKGLTGTIELATGEMQITDTLAIKGPGPDKLVIDAGGDSRIFLVIDNDADSPLAVSGLGFFGGNADGNNQGGAIFSLESLKVKNCVFKDNSAGGSGGAIQAGLGGQGGLSRVEIRNSVFTNNFNGSFGGGAVEIAVDGSAIVKNCTFAANVSDIRAGALSLQLSDGGIGSVMNCRFLGNAAPEHGALGVSLGNAKVNIVGNVFSGNEAVAGGGGAIAIFGNGETLFDRNLVSQNTSFQQGGGLFTGQFTSLKISNSRFLDNTSNLSGFLNSGGGAISIGGDEPVGSVAQITNSIISGNTSTVGGGIYIEDANFLLKITGSKITGNRSASDGGGIFSPSDSTASLELVKSELTGNVATGRGGGIFSAGGSLLTIKSSKVSQNTAASGGGLYLENTAPVKISGSVIAQNISEGEGGGIHSSAALEVSHTKFLGNVARTFGGALFITNNCEIVDSTISGNVAELGGAICRAVDPTFSLIHTKVIGNFSKNGEPIVTLAQV